MPEIFVGRSKDGKIKYLDQVPSGLACNCTCIVCNGPLVARKGKVNEWHFAHEGGQTHVDCVVGARNFLRRVAADVLVQALSSYRISPNQRDVNFAHLSQHVALNDEIKVLEAKVVPLDARIGLATIVATGTTLKQNIPFDLHVQVDGEQVPPASHVDRGLLLLRVPYFDSNLLCSEETTRKAIARSMTLEWQYLPNSHSVVRRTLADLRERHQKEASAANELARLQAIRKLHENSLPIQQRNSLQPQAHEVHNWISPHEANALSAPPPKPVAAPPPAWVFNYIGGSPFFCYRFRDGSYWLLGETIYGWLLHSWPWSEEGWDEALPASVGIPHAELGGYLCGSAFVEANLRVGAYSVGIRNTREQNELTDIFKQLGWQE